MKQKVNALILDVEQDPDIEPAARARILQIVKTLIDEGMGNEILVHPIDFATAYPAHGCANIEAELHAAAQKCIAQITGGVAIEQ
jgi:hypothetical protein